MNNQLFIQTQHWDKFDRILIVDTEHRGSVQVDILFNKEGKERLCADAFLYALWVDEDYRKQGEATALMAMAEAAAIARDCKAISLKWSSAEAPSWVYGWYERLGYEDTAFDYEDVLMVKKLK